MTTITYTVPAIHCGHCIHTIEMEVGELQGVQSVKADQNTKKVQITFDAPASEDRVMSAQSKSRLTKMTPSMPPIM